MTPCLPGCLPGTGGPGNRQAQGWKQPVLQDAHAHHGHGMYAVGTSNLSHTNTALNQHIQLLLIPQWAYTTPPAHHTAVTMHMHAMQCSFRSPGSKREAAELLPPRVHATQHDVL